jgi:hypothetical protein
LCRSRLGGERVDCEGGREREKGERREEYDKKEKENKRMKLKTTNEIKQKGERKNNEEKEKDNSKGEKEQGEKEKEKNDGEKVKENKEVGEKVGYRNPTILGNLASCCERGKWPGKANTTPATGIELEPSTADTNRT